MNQPPSTAITEQHLMLFGTVTQCFAQHEALMLEIMAAVSGADVTSIRLLTYALNFNQRRDALFNLLRHRAVPIDQIDQIRNYLQILQTYNALRHDIAHATWIDGKPKNSIRPLWLSHGQVAAIKPVHDTDGHTKPFIEDDDDRATYTLDDLREIGVNLTTNRAEFHDYLVKVNLMAIPTV
jgi:hypothetical protein